MLQKNVLTKRDSESSQSSQLRNFATATSQLRNFATYNNFVIQGSLLLEKWDSKPFVLKALYASVYLGNLRVWSKLMDR